MKTSLLFALLLVGLVVAQTDVDEAVKRYLNSGEDYATFEVAYQTAEGTQLANVLVIVRDAPVFVISRDGSLVEEYDAILAISRDYVDSRQSGTVIASAESIAASIERETQRRKAQAVVKEAGENALQRVQSAKQKIAAVKGWVPGLDFGLIDSELNSFEQTANDIATADSVEEAILLNRTFGQEFTPFYSFVIDLEANAIRLGSVANLTRQARQLLNEKIVRVGREDREVLELQSELSEIETLLNEELQRIKTLSRPDAELSASLYTRVERVVQRLGGLQGNSSDLVSILLPLIAVIAIILLVVFYFKKLREKQSKEEELPPEAAPPVA